MKDECIVVEDPSGNHRPGDIVSYRVGALMRRGGGVILPICEGGESYAVVSRQFGEGVVYEGGGTKGPGSMVMARPDARWLHWVALLEPLVVGRESQGTFRLMSSGGAGSLINAPLVPHDPRPGGLSFRIPQVTYGAARHSSDLQGAMGVQLFGQARNVKCRWLWITACAELHVDLMG